MLYWRNAGFGCLRERIVGFDRREVDFGFRFMYFLGILVPYCLRKREILLRFNV